MYVTIYLDNFSFFYFVVLLLAGKSFPQYPKRETKEYNSSVFTDIQVGYKKGRSLTEEKKKKNNSGECHFY